jgi:hypothetical protein
MNEIQKITNQAIDEGYVGANLAWKEMAHNCLKRICLARETFTMNDLRDLVRQSPIKTHDNRAMGGVMKWARKMGMVEATGATIVSKVGHKSPLQVWRSNIYKPKETLF